MIFPSDVHPEWVKLAAKSEQSIWILTPYLDRSLIGLLDEAQADFSSLVLVTDLSPLSAPERYRKKLETLRLALTRGAEVRSLARLHAKVLVVDETLLFAGSQNFTEFGRGSKEVTVYSVGSENVTYSIQILKRWIEEADLVSIEMIDDLIESMGEIATELDALIRIAGENYAEVTASRDRQERAAQVLKATRRNQLRNRSGSIWIKSEEVGEFDPIHYRTMLPRSNPYRTADTTINLLEWWDISGKLTILERLKMYPLILLPSGEMRFVRVARSRITYARTEVALTEKVIVGNLPINFTVDFTLGAEFGANLTLIMRMGEEEIHNFHFSFNGDQVALKGESSAAIRKLRPDQLEGIDTLRGIFNSDPAYTAGVVAQALEPFKYAELNRDYKDASRFFGQSPHRLRLLKFGEVHVFVASAL